MVKHYAFGLFSAALVVLAVGALWFGVQPKEEEGLLWGDTVYDNREEFNTYLKSKGLSYQTWLARNPGMAPWEPDTFRLGAITVEASPRKVQLGVAVVAWLLATVGAVLLLRDSATGTFRWGRPAAAVFSTVLAVVLVGFWYGTQPREKPGLLWGGAVYTSKEQFNLYLKSKGLSYKTWLARNPGAAPWEPEPVRRAKTRESAKAPPKATVDRPARAAATTDSDDGFALPSLFLPALALTLATGFAVLLLRGRRLVPARFATSAGSIRLPRAPLGDWGSTLSATAVESTQRLGRATRRSAGRVQDSAPVYGARVGRVTLRSAGHVGEAARVFGVRLGRASLDTARLLLRVARINGIGLHHVMIGLLVVVGAMVWGGVVVLVLSAL